MANPNVQHGGKDTTSMPTRESDKRNANTSAPDPRESQRASRDKDMEKGSKQSPSSERSTERDRSSTERTGTSERSSESRTPGKPH